MRGMLVNVEDDCVALGAGRKCAVPPGADEALERVLARIADGYPRTVDCPEGWHELIGDLAEQLAGSCPIYVIYQVKAWAGVRYYFGIPQEYEGKQELQLAMDQLVVRAQRRAAVTCETCGKVGARTHSPPTGRPQILCRGCRKPGYWRWLRVGRTATPKSQPA